MTLKSSVRPLLAMLIVGTAWWFFWKEPILHASSAEEPNANLAFYIGHIGGAIALGLLFPGFARWVGPVLLLAALISIALHVLTYDGSEGASFWPIALVLILFGMVALSAIALLASRAAGDT